MNKYHTLTLCIAATALLGACGQTTNSTKDLKTSQIDAVFERAVQDARNQGNINKSLAVMGKMYKRDSNNPVTATKYAKMLREADYLNRAAIILSPFAHAEDSTSDVLEEFTAVQLELGRYNTAEEFGQKAILKNAEAYKAYHYLGIALEAQGMHEEAERSFRKGLEFWEGDPAPIMNNLALNLASQGFLKEATDILERAAAIAPNRQDIERNLRIVNALKQTGEYNAPKPSKKPAE